MRLPLQTSASDTTGKVDDMLRMRRDKSGALRDILGDLTEYEKSQDARMKSFLDYSQSWVEKMKGMAE